MSSLQPLWVDRTDQRRYERLTGEVEADVVVIGAGIVGATAALLLRQQGLRVVLLEALRVAAQVTGGSSAKVTSQHSMICRDLARIFDEQIARRYGAANEWAIGEVERMVRTLEIECAFERRSAYTYAITPEREDDLRDEARVAAELGLPAQFTSEVPLPFSTVGAVRFDGQAQFDSFAYTAGLVAAVDHEGARVFEESRVTSLDDHNGVTVRTERGVVRARDVIIATTLPFIDDGMYFARTTPKAHAVIAARVADEPVAGMFISIDEPTRSMRSARRGDHHWLLVVGPAYTPGDSDTAQELATIEAFAREHFQVEGIDYRWWNEDYYSVDRLPYIGRIEPTRPHTYIATGFGGWGITNGVVAGHILAEAVQGRQHRWADVFDPAREGSDTHANPLASFGRMVRDNVATVENMAARFIPETDGDLETIAPGDGAVIPWHGEKLAVTRDASGELHALSALCTHLGCEVAWNGAMQTWDCGCHGSCFDVTGSVLRGPAVHPLEAHDEALTGDATDEANGRVAG
ncbi:MAG: FAD-dependent oxidoreductase [Chloroflexota bacterium]